VESKSLKKSWVASRMPKARMRGRQYERMWRPPCAHRWMHSLRDIASTRAQRRTQKHQRGAHFKGMSLNDPRHLRGEQGEAEDVIIWQYGMVNESEGGRTHPHHSRCAVLHRFVLNSASNTSPMVHTSRTCRWMTLDTSMVSRGRQRCHHLAIWR